MKKLVISLKLFLVIFVVQTSQAQDSFYGKVYYGNSKASLLSQEQSVSVISTEVQDFREFGVLFGKELNKSWAFEIGINSSSAKIKYILNQSAVSAQESSVLIPFENFQMLSFPISMRYSIFPFLYLVGGPILDFQNSDNNSFDQSGIGFQVGIGAQHYFNNVRIFVQPHFKRHAAIPFESTNYNLSEFGVQFGVAYKF